MRFFMSKKRGYVQPFSFSKTRMAGFTMIELMVAAAIIGILASVVLASLNEARKKARDAQRMSDLQQVQLALRQYKDVHGSYPFYPEGTKISVLQEDNYPGDPAKGGELKAFFPDFIVDPLDTSSVAETDPQILDPQSNIYLYNSHIKCDDGKYHAVIVARSMELDSNVKRASECHNTDPLIFRDRAYIDPDYDDTNASFGTAGLEYAIILK